MLVTEHGSHRQDVEDQDERGVETHVADAYHVALRGDQQTEACETKHHDAEAGREYVALTGAGIDGFLAMQEIQDEEDEEIEDATPQHVPHR